MTPHSRLSRKLAHAAHLRMSDGLALEFDTGVGCRRVRGLTPICYVSRSIAARAFARDTIPNRKACFPLAVLWVRLELRSCGWSRESGETALTGHPYRAAKQRQRLAPGVNPGLSRFRANPAANAANRKHPYRSPQPSQRTTTPHHDHPGCSPADAARPSRFVALRRPSCSFVDQERFSARDCSSMEAKSCRFSDSLAVLR